jgi:integrase
MGRRPTRNLHLPRGMRARVRGKVTYYFLDAGGKPRREIPLGRDYTAAVARWAELTGENRAKAAPTFRDAAERFQREAMPGLALKTQREYTAAIGRLLRYFDDPPAPLDAIKPIAVARYLDWRRAAPVAANREIAVLSAIWNRARVWGYTDLANPCTGVTRHRQAGRSVYVEDEVYRAVWDAADQPLRDAMDLAYLTGQRPADVRRMAVTDLRGGDLHIRQAKTGGRNRIAVTGELAAFLADLDARRKADREANPATVHALQLILDEHGQPMGAWKLRSRFDRARAKAAAATPDLAAAIREFQFRDLRARAGTDKAESAGVLDAQRQLGHSSVTTTERYVRRRRGAKSTPTR